MSRQLGLILVLATLALAGTAAGATNEAGKAAASRETDVVIYGGTSAGVAAAVQVSRMGKRVILVAPELHLGGLTSGGLGWTDVGSKEIIGGIAREFYQRVWKHYDRPEAWRWQRREDYGNRGQGTRAADHELRTMWIFEPHVAERVFEEMIAEEGIVVLRGVYLDREHGVKVDAGRILSFASESGERFAARVFIDATYEGDLMAAAGASYHVGRESNSVYDETWNGSQPDVRHHDHWFKSPIDPYVIPGDPESGLLPRVSEEQPLPPGSGDKRIQAYCFRICLTRTEENRVPFSRPADYDPGQYELLLRVFDSGWRETFRKFDPIPNNKTDTNNHGPFSTDNIGMNYDYPEASHTRRREIIAEHESYQKGLMYFMSNDPRMPEDVRTEVSKWGLAKDEFADNNHWPHQIYVREARRMAGEYVITEHDCLGRRNPARPVGMGAYTMDSHNTMRYVTRDGNVQNEGDMGISVKKPYGIDYGAITPKASGVTNLLVPVCLSASHIAFGSIRMEPVFMILGQSAATAAVHAIEEDKSVQEISYPRLRERLTADDQRLEVK